MWQIATLLLALIAVAPVTPQRVAPQNSPGARPGNLVGRVFAITHSGDLKPARIADVYVFYEYRSVAFANKNPSDEDSAGMTWMEQHNKAMEDLNKELERQGANWSESLSCRKELLTYLHATVETLKWAEAEKKAWQVISTQTDEEGNFSVSIPRPGKYLLLVRGRAGLNEAAWRSDVTIAPGQPTNVKLTSPEKACLDAEGN